MSINDKLTRNIMKNNLFCKFKGLNMFINAPKLFTLALTINAWY